jgi:CheY-like chemotaxis protein
VAHLRLFVNEEDQRPSILIVDDSLFMRRRVRQSLGQDRYILVEATSGVSALGELDKRSFDCILTDLLMPEMDGFELLAELQRRHSVTPVVVVTADIQKTTRERCEVLGATDIIQKPVPPERLRSVVEGIVGERC